MAQSVLTVIEQILRRLGCETSMAQGKVRSTCPLAQWTHGAGRDEKPSFVVFPHGRDGSWPPIYTCLGCGESGSFEDLLLRFWSARIIDASGPLLALYEAAGGPDLEVTSKPRTRVGAARAKVEKSSFSLRQRNRSDKKWHDKISISQCRDVPELPAGYYDQFRGSVPRYALDRGLAVETCKAWDLGHDRVGKRLMFPLYDDQRRLVAVSGRAYSCLCGASTYHGIYRCKSCKVPLADGAAPCPACGGEPKKIRSVCDRCGHKEPPKYLHSDGFKRNLFLYGEHLRKSGGTTGYIVEGNLDALMLWQAGYRPALATLGSNVVLAKASSSVQVEKMVSWFERVIIVSDGDEPGRRMAESIKRATAGRIIAVHRPLPEGEDPTSMVKNKLEELRRILKDLPVFP